MTQRSTRTRKPARTGRAADSPLFGLDLVACVGGPLDGQWFHRDDWQAKVNAARAMGHDEETPAGCSIGYIVDDKPTVQHPREPVRGRAATWVLG